MCENDNNLMIGESDEKRAKDIIGNLHFSECHLY